MENFFLEYSAAYVLDLIIGDPVYSFHPIRIIGILIVYLENKLYPMKNKRKAGFYLLIITMVFVFLSSYFLSHFGSLVRILLLYTTLATRALANEGMKIYKVVKSGDNDLARREISYLVSRDTNEMNERDIVRSTLETISENSSDGVIAPMFFAFLGSFIVVSGVSLALPFAMVYKCVNTLDSMVGYKNDKYIDFGRYSAKFDDVLNFIPARIAGFILIPLGALILRYDYNKSIEIFLRDRKNHSSPNSGCPEAAFAGALHFQFGGKTSYFGVMQDKPTIGDKVNEFHVEDIRKAVKLLYATSLIGLLLFSMFKYVV